MIIIERIREGIALLETENGLIEISAELLPFGAEEGDVLISHSDGYERDIEATEERRTSILSRRKALLNRKQGTE